MKILKALPHIVLISLALFSLYKLLPKEKEMPPAAASKPKPIAPTQPIPIKPAITPPIIQKTKLEQDIEKSLVVRNRIMNMWFNMMIADSAGSVASDSLDKAQIVFCKLLYYYVKKYPATLQFHFDSLEKQGIQIQTAPDGKFRMYTFSAPELAALHSYQCIFQYKSENGNVYARLMPKKKLEDGKINTESLINGIYLVHNPGKTYYLIKGFNTYSGTLCSESMDAYSIEDTVLNGHVGLIKTKNGITSHLGFQYDPSTLKDKSQKYGQLLNYDTVNQIISFPVVQKGGDVTNKTIQYHFNGQYFEKKE